jgi:hypothetical protein
MLLDLKIRRRLQVRKPRRPALGSSTAHAPEARHALALDNVEGSIRQMISNVHSMKKTTVFRDVKFQGPKAPILWRGLGVNGLPLLAWSETVATV